LITRVPNELKGKIWHSTSKELALEIYSHGYIIFDPSIDESKRWGGKSKSTHPFVRSIGGISLFDFRLPSSHVSEILYSFIPCRTGWPQTVWLEINHFYLGDMFSSAEETRIRWIEAGMNRQYMPKLEAASLRPIPIEYIKSIYISNKKGIFKPVNISDLIKNPKKSVLLSRYK
jgi:hypothetical protein